MVAWILNRPGKVGVGPYVAGVFATRAAAERHMASIPEASRCGCSVDCRESLSFPCFVAEDGEGLRFLSEAEVRAELAHAAAHRKGDDDWCYVNLYRLTGEFLPAGPGRDDMGRLPHWHIHNADLDDIARGGLATLWRQAL
jgi:hypothetical protein